MPRLFSRLYLFQRSALKEHISLKDITQYIYFNRRDINPTLKKFLALPSQSTSSIHFPSWTYELTNVLLRGIQHALVLKLLAVLTGLVIREYMRVQTPSVMSTTSISEILKVCPVENDPYSAGGVTAMATVAQSFISRIISASRICSSYDPLLTMTMLSLISMVLTPLLNDMSKSILARSYFEHQLQEQWYGDVNSKYDFRDEAVHSLSLQQSVLVAVCAVTFAITAAILLSSPVYVIVALFSVWQLFSLIFVLPESTVHNDRAETVESCISDNLRYKLMILL